MCDNEPNGLLKDLGGRRKNGNRTVVIEIKRLYISFGDGSYTSTLPVSVEMGKCFRRHDRRDVTMFNVAKWMSGQFSWRSGRLTGWEKKWIRCGRKMAARRVGKLIR